jgi:hypothetical protein
LAPADLTDLGINHPVSGPSTTHAGCGWTADAGAGTVGIDWNPTVTDGLSDLYAKSSTIAYWQPITVDGYPAAFGDAISDGRSQGDCVLNVAVNDHSFFTASYAYPPIGSGSCDVAKQAASDVLRNLKTPGGS